MLERRDVVVLVVQYEGRHVQPVGQRVRRELFRRGPEASLEALPQRGTHRRAQPQHELEGLHHVADVARHPDRHQ